MLPIFGVGSCGSRMAMTCTPYLCVSDSVLSVLPIKFLGQTISTMEYPSMNGRKSTMFGRFRRSARLMAASRSGWKMSVTPSFSKMLVCSALLDFAMMCLTPSSFRFRMVRRDASRLLPMQTMTLSALVSDGMEASCFLRVPSATTACETMLAISWIFSGCESMTMMSWPSDVK